MLKIVQGDIKTVIISVERALRRLAPPTSVNKTRENELWLNPI